MVSILIPTYNCAKYLPNALASVLTQTYGDYEVLVIDDGSTDGTAQVVAKFQDDFGGRLKYIYQENQGLACARNTAIENAKGTYLALLDADDVWLPHRLKETLHSMEADAQIGLVHANIRCIDEQGKTIGVPHRDPAYLSGNIFDHIFVRRADISCPTVLFRRECCEKVGLFDPNLARLGCEDRDLWLRIARHYKIAYVHKVLALYRVSPASMSRQRLKMLQARLYVINKFCPPDSAHRGLRNEALAKVYRDLGDEALLAQDFAEARRQYGRSIRLNPRGVWSWINFCKTIGK